jgi:isoleucyl-tRNA synthetase
MAGEPKRHFLAEIEEELLNKWEKNKTFEASLSNRKDEPVFKFFDGPPFANGIPHYGHLEQTTIKDTVTRYKTMKGFYVPRRVGWDTHGLPVEYAIEKEHGFKSKKDIVSYGIAKFNEECRDSVFKYKDVWEKMFRRVGRWADYTETYATLDKDYMESVWWVFKTIYDKGLVYKDFRSSPYCPRCATPLSNFELNLGYKDNVEDPSLFVKFKLVDEEAFLLGWTTTPWSLPGNAAIAVKPEAKYVYVELIDETTDKSEVLVIARERLEILDENTFNIIKEVKGRDLVGLGYEPLFKLSETAKEKNDSLYKVWGAEFVSIDDGSGVLHVAPAFGEDDLSLAKQHNIPVLITVDENGHVINDKLLPESIRGKFFKGADNPLIEHLTKADRVFAAEHILHTYPFCWRCDTPLLYYATDSWLIKVTDIRDKLVSNNQQINWVPSYIKDGRFGKWIGQARDWAVSRNRFWGAPIPIWMTKDGEMIVIGSIDELKERAVDPSKIDDLHRPYIDDVVLKTDSGKLAYRIPEVFDCWFESGSMPYGQSHYPFENKENWDSKFPAEFIAEAVDQTRGWFYTMHVIATALFGESAYSNVICSGWIVAADGEKLSKRKKNYAPMDEVFDQFGVDTLRFFLASSPLMNGEDTRFSVDFLRDVQRKIFMTLYNTFTFYNLYAKVDHWEPPKTLEEPTSSNLLDQWMLSRLNETVKIVESELDSYRLDRAARPITDLVDDMSNWFVRRSRRRFWKAQDDSDKQQAYETLYYVLIVTCQLLAPFSPFLTDYIWSDLTEGTDLPDSIHLSDWPTSGKVNHKLVDSMKFVRESITQGLYQRARAGIKVRQPLSSVKVIDSEDLLKDFSSLKQLIEEELNVKEVNVSHSAHKKDEEHVEVDIKLTPELRLEGMARDIVRLAQEARKKADLNVEDRIELSLASDNKEINDAIKKHQDFIMSETLAINLVESIEEPDYNVESKIDGSLLTIVIKRVKS